jgi:hypothetical protein
LPESINGDLQEFTNLINKELPENSIFKEMGLGTVDVELLFEQVIKNFNLTANE